MIIILLILFGAMIFSFLSLAPWAPTRGSDFDRVHRFSGLKKGQIFLEVGCGTGSVSLYIAKNNSEANIIGIELSPLFYLISTIRVHFSGLKNIKIQYGNALKQDFGNYDVIYIYGLPKALAKSVCPKLQSEMKKGSKMLSYCFEVGDDKVKAIQHKEQSTVLSIYEYIKD